MPWRLFTSKIGEYIPWVPLNAVFLKVPLCAWKWTVSQEAATRRHHRRRSWVAWGVSLKSALWVECSYPFPSPRGIKGLFLGAASVEPHNAEYDLKLAKTKKVSDPSVLSARRMSCWCAEFGSVLHAYDAWLLSACLCVLVCAHPNNFLGFGCSNGSIIMASLQNRKMKLKS